MYYYLDSTPTHSYMKFLYKYPQREYPYEQLVRESNNRDRTVGEFEITDTDMFDDDRYWDIFIEYAKDEDNAEGISIRITAYNRGPEPATLHILPQLWFRNTWSWPKDRPTGKAMPSLSQIGEGLIQSDHETLGRYYFHANSSPAPVDPATQGDDDEAVLVDDVVVPELLFTENDTNFARLYGGNNVTPYNKDAFHDHVIPGHRPALPKAEKPEKPEKAAKAPKVPKSNGSSTGSETDNATDEDEDDYGSDTTAGTSTPTDRHTTPDEREFVNPEKKGTKAGAHYVFHNVPANGGCAVVRLKLTTKTAEEDPAANDEESFDMIVEERRMDSDEFYSRFNSGALSDDLRNIMRQALSGMLWCAAGVFAVVGAGRLTLCSFARRTKQFYMFIQKEWIEGDPGQPPPPPERKFIRNMVRPVCSNRSSSTDRKHAYTGLEAHVHRGRAVDARQVGVSLLRHLGLGAPPSTTTGQGHQLMSTRNRHSTASRSR